MSITSKRVELFNNVKNIIYNEYNEHYSNYSIILDSILDLYISNYVVDIKDKITTEYVDNCRNILDDVFTNISEYGINNNKLFEMISIISLIKVNKYIKYNKK